MTARRFFSAFALLAALPVASIAAEPARKYSYNLDSTIELDAGENKAFKLRAETRHDYTLQPVEDGKLDLSIDLLTIETSMNDQSLGKTTMSAERFVIPIGKGQKRVFTPADAPPELKERLGEFGRPLAQYKIGPEGEDVGEPKLLIPNGVLVMSKSYILARICHPRFPAKENKWVVKTSIPMGSGLVAVGDVTYEKLGPADAEGRTKVKLSGTLKAEGKVGNAMLEKGTYDLAGTQTYSDKLKDWETGDYTMTLNFTAASPQLGPTKGKGTMTMTLRPRK